jgi:hypothetical protein
MSVRHGRSCLVVGFRTTYASVPITTKVMSLNPAHGEVYSIQHYVIKFVSGLSQVSGFLRVLQFPPPINLTNLYFYYKHVEPLHWFSGISYWQLLCY